MNDDTKSDQMRLKALLKERLGVDDPSCDPILDYLVSGVVPVGEAQRLGERGAELANAGRHEEALAIFCQVIAMEPENAVAWANRGRSKEALGRCDEALEDYDAAAALDPKLDIQPEKARAFMRLGRFLEALPMFDTALAANPMNPAVVHNRGVCLLEMNRREEALNAFERVTELNPKHVPAARMKATVLKSLGRSEEAAAAMRAFLEIYHPEDAQGLFSKGNEALELGLAEISRDTFKSLTELLPEEAQGYHGLGSALSVLGDYDASAGAFQKAMALDPKNAASRIGALATVLTRAWSRDQQAGETQLLTAERRRRIVDCFADWHRARPSEGQPWLALGAFHLMNHEDEEAVRCFEEARRRGDSKASVALEAVSRRTGIRPAPRKPIKEEPTAPKQGRSWLQRWFG